MDAQILRLSIWIIPFGASFNVLFCCQHFIFVSFSFEMLLIFIISIFWRGWSDEDDDNGGVVWWW